MRYAILLGALSAVAIAQVPAGISAAGARTAARLTKRAATEEAASADGIASRSNSPVIRQQVSREPVTWELTTTACPALPAATKGTGRFRHTITIAKNPNGSNNYRFLDEASGTANDNQGHNYIWIYQQNVEVESGTGIPEPKIPFNFAGPDTFELIPIDGGPSVKTVIYFKARINANGDFVDQGTIATPNFSCDAL